MIAVWHIMPALRAGNVVISKPSEYTPLSTLRLCEIIQQEVPAGVISIVVGAGEIGEAFIFSSRCAKSRVYGINSNRAAHYGWCSSATKTLNFRAWW